MHGRKRKARKTRAEHTQRRKQELDATELGSVIFDYDKYIFMWNSPGWCKINQPWTSTNLTTCINNKLKPHFML